MQCCIAALGEGALTLRVSVHRVPCAANVLFHICVLQVKQLAAYLTQREAEGEPTFKYARATVTK